MSTSTEEPEWTLLYHHFNPPFPGRAQGIRLLFVDAGVPYVETGEGLYGSEGYCDVFRGPPPNRKIFVKELAKKQLAPYPVLAPPLIWHRKNGEEVFINQVPAIMRYVGTVLGYGPKGAMDTAKCDKILLDVGDYITEGRGSFHPVDGKKSYSIQKEEGDRVSKEWSKSRMLIWLHMFEKILEKNTSTSGYAVGDSPTYADFALYWACLATEAQFDKEFYDFAWTNAEVPKLKAFKKQFDERPNIAAWEGSFEWSGDSMM